MIRGSLYGGIQHNKALILYLEYYLTFVYFHTDTYVAWYYSLSHKWVIYIIYVLWLMLYMLIWCLAAGSGMGLSFCLCVLCSTHKKGHDYILFCEHVLIDAMNIGLNHPHELYKHSFHTSAKHECLKLAYTTSVGGLALLYHAAHMKYSVQ